jgi:hypothetical protein
MNSRRLAFYTVFLAAAGAAAGQVSITTPSPLPTAYDGFSYSVPMTANTNPPGGSLFWFIPEGSTPPPGLFMNESGVFGGFPNFGDSGTYTFTVEVDYSSQAGRSFDTKQFTINVVDPMITITSSSPLPDAIDGVPYSFTFTANNNTPFPLEWFAETTPPGLSLSYAGVLSGIPTSTGSFPFTVYADFPDSDTSFSQDFVLTEYAGQVVITSASLPIANVGKVYSATVHANPPGVTWLLGNSMLPSLNLIDVFRGDYAGPPPTVTLVNDTSSLPPGISFDPSTGTFSGIPTTTGVYPQRLQAVFPNFLPAQVTLNLYVTNGPLSITPLTLPPATKGQPYQTTLTAAGGLGPFSWQISNVVGLSIGATTGIISGTPNTTGTATVTVTLADSLNEQVTTSYSLVINGSLSVTTTTLPAGSTTAAYSQMLAAAGGQSPYTWKLSPTSILPPGLSLSSDGNITGTPTANGVYRFGVVVTDAAKAIATGTVSITIGALTITTTSLPEGGINRAYSQTLAASGGALSYSWAVTTGTLPAGLMIDSKTGIISGTPTGPAGPSTFTVTVTDSTSGTPQLAQKIFTLNIASGLSISTLTLPNATVQTAYSQTVQASGGTTPYNFTFTGSLPSGVTLAASTGVIGGTPAVSGQFNIVVTVTDAGGQAAQQALALLVTGPLTFAPPSSFSATVGTPFSQMLTASGGSPGYNFSVSSGTLPGGLAINATTGAITGTPTTQGTAAVTFLVTDQLTQKASASVTFNVTLPPTPPVAFTLGSASQPPVNFCLGSGYPLPVTVTLTVTFQPASSVAVGTDASVQFALPGTGSVVTFTAPACGANPPPSAVVTMATVAGTITVTPKLTANGIDITPPGLAPQTMAVTAVPPVIQSVTLTKATGSLTVTVLGFSSTREVSSGTFLFTSAAGSTLTQNSIQVTLSPAFTTWYQNSSSNAFGSQFKLTQQFNVSGDSSAITGVTVTLTNQKGASPAVASQ